jgi:hypothetical protein
MQIKAEITLPYPRERVFSVYRDRLAELAAGLPNIRSVTVVSRSEREGAVELVNKWVGGGDIPAVARSFLSESMLTWTDHATWRSDTFTVAWRTDVHAFPGAIQSSGENRYVEAPGGMRLELGGELTCDATKIPGVPRLVARTVSSAVEKMLVGSIEKNLAEIGKGLCRLLETSTA